MNRMRLCLLELFAVLYLVVKVVEQEDENQRYGETEDECNEEYHRLARSNGMRGRTRFVHNLGGHDRRSESEGVLFAFFVEVDEEFLFNLLLALDFHILTLFGRYLSDEAVVLFILAGDIVFRDNQSLFVVSDRGDNTTAKLGQLLVKLRQFGVVLGSGTGDLHAVE